MGDIESMFYQVHARPEYTSFLSFLWWSDDPCSNIVEFQMVVHLFGATSSTSCTNFYLRKPVENWTGHFSDETIKNVLRTFNVDECRKSLKSAKSAMFPVKNFQRLLAMKDSILQSGLVTSVKS